MRLFQAIRSILATVDHWVHETYCRVGERACERLESVSDRLAEKRYEAEHRRESSRSPSVPAHPPHEISELRVINGHKHAD